MSDRASIEVPEGYLGEYDGMRVCAGCGRFALACWDAEPCAGCDCAVEPKAGRGFGPPRLALRMTPPALDVEEAIRVANGVLGLDFPNEPTLAGLAADLVRVLDVADGLRGGREARAGIALAALGAAFGKGV